MVFDTLIVTDCKTYISLEIYIAYDEIYKHRGVCMYLEIVQGAFVELPTGTLLWDY